MESVTIEFTEVYQNFYAPIVIFLCSVSGDNASAEDIAQEVFMLYLQQRVKGITFNNPYGWLLRTAQFHFLNHSRQGWNSLVEKSGLDCSPPVDGISFCPDSYFVCEDIALTILSKHELNILILVGLHSCKYTDAGKQLGLSADAVSRHYYNACRKMRSNLKEKGIEHHMELL